MTRVGRQSVRDGCKQHEKDEDEVLLSGVPRSLLPPSDDEYEEYEEEEEVKLDKFGNFIVEETEKLALDDS